MRRQHPITSTLAIVAAITLVSSTLYAGDIIVDAGQDGALLKKCMGNDNPTRSSNLNKMYMNYTIKSFDDMVTAVQKNFPNSYKCYLAAKTDASKTQATGPNEPVSQSSVNQPAGTHVQVPTQTTSVVGAGQTSGSMQSSSGSEKLLSKCLVNYNGDVGKYIAETHDKDAAEAIDKILKDKTNYMYPCLMPIVRGSKVYADVFAKATDAMRSCISSKIGLPPFDPSLVDATFDKCIDYPRSSTIWDTCLSDNKSYYAFANCFVQKINASPRRVPASIDDKLITALNNSILKIADAVKSGLAADDAALNTSKVVWPAHAKSIQTCVASKGASCDISGAEGVANQFIARWTSLSQLQPRVKECVGDLRECYTNLDGVCMSRISTCENAINKRIMEEKVAAEEAARAQKRKDEEEAKHQAEQAKIAAEQAAEKDRMLREQRAIEYANRIGGPNDPGTPAQDSDAIAAAFDAIKRDDYATSLRILQPMANMGNAVAQFNIGVMYLNGEGVERSVSEGISWYKKSAVLGNVSAQFRLGRIYQEGKIVRNNNIEAAKWWKMAAANGHAEAQTLLGFMYNEGLGVQKDMGEALKLLHNAANQGERNAMITMARIYKGGKDGVSPDLVQAYKWIEISKNHAIGGADTGEMRELTNRMTKEQIEEAKKQIADYKPTDRDAFRRSYVLSLIFGNNVDAEEEAIIDSGHCPQPPRKYVPELAIRVAIMLSNGSGYNNSERLKVSDAYAHGLCRYENMGECRILLSCYDKPIQGVVVRAHQATINVQRLKGCILEDTNDACAGVVLFESFR